MIQKIQFTNVIFIFIISINSFAQNKDYTFELNFSDDENKISSYVNVYKDSLKEKFLESYIINDKKFTIEVNSKINCFYLEVLTYGFEENFKKICSQDSSTIKKIFLKKKKETLDEVLIESFQDTKIKISGSKSTLKPGRILKEDQANSTLDLVKYLPDVTVNQEKIRLRGHDLKYIFLHTSANSYGRKISPAKLTELPVDRINYIEVSYIDSEIHIYFTEVKPGLKIDNTSKATYGRLGYVSSNSFLNFKKGKFSIWYNPLFGNINQKNKGESLNDYVVNENNIELFNSNSTSETNQNYFSNFFNTEYQIDSLISVGLNLNFDINESIDQTSFLSISESIINNSVIDEESSSIFLSSSLYLSGKIKKSIVYKFQAGYYNYDQEYLNDAKYEYDFQDINTEGSQNFSQNNDIEGFNLGINIRKSFKNFNLSFVSDYNETQTVSSTSLSRELINMNSINDMFKNNLSESNLKTQLKLDFNLSDKSNLNFNFTYIFYSFKFDDFDNGVQFQNTENMILPSLNYSFLVKENKSLSLFFNSYIYTPNLSNQIFRSLSQDGFTTNENNSNLEPSTTYQYGFSYPFFNALNVSVYSSNTYDQVIFYPEFSTDGAFRGNKIINLSKNSIYSLNASYSKLLFNKLFVSSSLIFAFNNWENEINPEFQTNFTSINAMSSFRYYVKKDWIASLDFNYLGTRDISENLVLKSWSELSIGISKNINDNWYVFGKVNDLFNSYNIVTFSQNPNINYNSKSLIDSRSVTIGVKYTFSKRSDKLGKNPKSDNSIKNKLKLNRSEK